MAKRHYAENEMKIKHVENKIQELDRRRYSKLRDQHPEFQDLSDSDLKSYIEVYDDHLGLGFTPYSL